MAKLQETVDAFVKVTGLCPRYGGPLPTTAPMVIRLLASISTTFLIQAYLYNSMQHYFHFHRDGFCSFGIHLHLKNKNPISSPDTSEIRDLFPL